MAARPDGAASGGGPVRLFLRSALAATATLLATGVVAGGGVLLSLVTGPVSPAIHACYRAYARLALWGFRTRVRARGLEHLEPGERYAFVSNHQSNLDPLALIVALADHPLRFVAKQELSRVPVFGAALRASGTVFVTRTDTKTDVARIEAAQAELVKHVSVLFFAEGTRSLTGELGAFKKGAAVFAVRNGLRLVPVGVAGSFEILPRGLRVLRAGTIGVSVGRPIATEGRTLEGREALTAALREAVVAEIGRARELAG